MPRSSGADGEEAIFGRFLWSQGSLARVDGQMRELSLPIAQTLSALARLEQLEIKVGTYLLLQQAHRELQSHKKSPESALSKPIDQPGNAFVTARR